ncbi:hypothetical protein HZC34_01900 [Candidatus Saganbacteria bacterium]|nr:hypothetical protein [Candidatus Saganbacteria bacterium]
MAEIAPAAPITRRPPERIGKAPRRESDVPSGALPVDAAIIRGDIAPGAGTSAAAKVAIPDDNEKRTPGGFLRAKFNRMCEQSESSLRLSKKFADKVDKLIDKDGNIDLKQLKALILEDTGLSDDNFKEDNFLKLFGDGKASISYIDLKNRIDFYQQVLYARYQLTREGFLQIMRKDEIVYYKLHGSEDNIDVTGLGRNDKETYNKYLDLAWRAYYTSAASREEQVSRYEEWQKTKEDPPKHIKTLLFYIYHAAYESYCLRNNIEFDGVDLNNARIKDRFLRGIFSAFIKEGGFDKKDLNSSFWNFLRPKAKEKYYINEAVINAFYLKNVKDSKLPEIAVPTK